MLNNDTEFVIALETYSNQKSEALNLIKDFWRAHNDNIVTLDEANQDLDTWTGTGHIFYFITYNAVKVGFIHLGNRGASIDWLEDIFVLPQYQNKGIGSKAIALVEAIVSKYSESLYIEAAARNARAITLYSKLGYNCLNTISVRKDFDRNTFETVRNETLYDTSFEIRKRK